MTNDEETSDSRNEAMPCIVCRKQLASAYQSRMQPEGGMTFTSGGAYGATAFDPMDASELVITICDECIVSAARERAGLVLHDRSLRGVAVMMGQAPLHVGRLREDGEPNEWDPDDHESQDPVILSADDVLDLDVPDRMMLSASMFKSLKDWCNR